MFEGNPFPGLRPFQFNENYLFFGREEQVAQLLQRLGNTRFLAVVGASGSGKSSLVRAGLLPELHGGTMTSTSIAWELAIMRPGGDPLTNLAESLVESGLFGEENEENILQTRATLSRSGLGLIEAYRQSSIDKGANLLLLVDQFEEIFRFRQSGNKASQEAAHFIQLLLETARQSEVPIYIILTMRSDFLGDCAEFKGLAEAVNEGEYLIPRLNRKQRARAIEGPVKVGGADISPRLKQQLLNDIGDDPDQLPILQHALMRMWDHWEINTDKSQSLDLEHYDAIGRMAEALSRHADEVYDELPDDEHRLLCMKLFKAITEKQADGRGIRRPLPFGEIDEITGHQREKMLAVIDAFRPTGRTFIMPGESVSIHDQIIIDISHESLMRVWVRLKKWVNEEADSARIYVRLCETAELHNRGEAGFYRDPDLKISLSWRDNNKPNANWGARINDSFDLAMRFLDDSKEDFEAELKAKEEARKRELEQAKALAEAEKQRAEIQRKSAKRNKVFAGVLFLLAVFAGFMAYQATLAEKRAVASEGKAKMALSDAHLVEAERLLDRNEPHNAIALLTKSYRENPGYPILLQRAISIADTQKLPYYEEKIIDNKAHVILDAARGFQYDSNGQTVALLHKEKGNSFLSVYQLESGKLLFRTPKLEIAESVHYTADGKHAVVACKTDKGNWDGVIVYNIETGKEVNRLETTPSPAIFGVVSNDLKDLVAGTGRGEVYHSKHPEYKKEKILHANHDIWEVKLHPTKRLLAIVEVKDNASYKFYYKDLNNQEPPRVLYSSPEDQQRFFSQCRFSPSGAYLALHGGNVQVGSLLIFDGLTGNELFRDELTHQGAIFNVSFSPDETLLATASEDNTARFWNVKTFKTFGSVMHHNAEAWKGEFSPDQSRFSVFTSNGELAVWSTATGTLTHDFIKHDSPVIMTAFTNDGKSVFAGLTNGQVHKWNLMENAHLPIILSHTGKMLGIKVDPAGQLIVTSAEDGKIKIWDPGNYKLMKEVVVEKDPVTGGDVWQLAFNKDGTLLGTFQNNSPESALSFKLWSWPEVKLLSQFKFPTSVSSTAFSPDGNLVAFSNNESFEFSTYNISESSVVNVNQDHGDKIFGIKFSQDGKLVATACLDGYARVYNTSTHKQVVAPLPFGYNFGANVDFSLDNKLLLTRTNLGRDANNVVMWELTSGNEKYRFEHNSGIMNHFFSFDGKRVYTCGKDNMAKMWSLENGDLLGVYKQSEYVLSVEEFPDNRDKILTVDRTGNARIWNTLLGKVVDGPFRGIGGFDWWMTAGTPVSNHSGFVSSYGNYAAAYWANPISLSKFSLDSTIDLFLEDFIGGKMDENSSFKLSDRNLIVQNKSLLSFNSKDDSLNQWTKWRTNQEKHHSSSFNEGIDREKLIQFLLSQNTMAASQAALIFSPMNKDVMRQLGRKYARQAAEKKSDEEMKDFYYTRGEWYMKASE